MADLNAFVHEYPFLTIAVILYIASEMLPEKLKFRNAIALFLQSLSVFAALYQFNLIQAFFELVKNFVTTLLNLA